ncbi:MAG: hypothetical protein NXI24_11215 [bacterium]|nr:hypothetical protein [bacterium]
MFREIRNRQALRDSLRENAAPLLILLALLCAGLLLKLYYSGAPDDEPRWLLAATARLFSIASGIGFQFQEGRGYLSGDGRLLLYRGCSGLNIFVMAILLVGLVPPGLRLEFSGSGPAPRRKASPVSFLIFYVTALSAAFAVTLLANTGRMLALLAAARIAPEALHPGALHMGIGSFVYLVFLILFYFSVRLIFQKLEPEI